ncbi:hypothetical protein H4R35_006395 [Dimargaris xerosporica]|nr:hypothetical protein H4R35_006395 [Dimargaris xerosporica]
MALKDTLKRSKCTATGILVLLTVWLLGAGALDTTHTASAAIQPDQDLFDRMQLAHRHPLQRRRTVHDLDSDDGHHRWSNDMPGSENPTLNDHNVDSLTSLIDEISSELVLLFSPEDYMHFRDVFAYQGVRSLLQELRVGVRLLLLYDEEGQKFISYIIDFLIYATSHYSDQWGELGLLALVHETLNIFTGEFNEYERSVVGECLENAIHVLGHVLKWEVYRKARDVYSTGIAAQHPNSSDLAAGIWAFHAEFGDVISLEWMNENAQQVSNLVNIIQCQNYDAGVQLLSRFVMVNMRAPEQRHVGSAKALSLALESQLLQ